MTITQFGERRKVKKRLHAHIHEWCQTLIYLILTKAVLYQIFYRHSLAFSLFTLIFFHLIIYSRTTLVLHELLKRGL